MKSESHFLNHDTLIQTLLFNATSRGYTTPHLKYGFMAFTAPLSIKMRHPSKQEMLWQPCLNVAIFLLEILFQ